MSVLGKGNAAVVLSSILIQLSDDKITHRVHSIYNDYCIGLRHIERMSDKSYRNRTALIWRNDFKQRVRDQHTFPIEITSHLLNVLSVRYRETLRK